MERVDEILVAVFKLNQEQVIENMRMEDVGNWDSLTHMDLIVAIEDILKIELSGDDIADMITFDAVREIVQKYI